jgi:hypothetical protein
MLLHTRHLARIRSTRLPCWRWQGIRIRSYVSESIESNGDPAWFQELRKEMLSRPVATSREHITLDTDHKLTQSLSAFLPPRWSRRISRNKAVIPLGHNLVWFNTSMPVDQLLPDGTDPLQSPGEPWVRRMWAGGSMQAKGADYYDFDKGFTPDSYMLYAERIQDVRLRGSGDAAKIFVTIERRYARTETLDKTLVSLREQDAGSKTSISAILREQMLRGEEWGDAILKEERNLVFLKEKTPAELELIAAGQTLPVKYLDCLSTSYSALRDLANNLQRLRNLTSHIHSPQLARFCFATRR